MNDYLNSLDGIQKSMIGLALIGLVASVVEWVYRKLR